MARCCEDREYHSLGVIHMKQHVWSSAWKGSRLPRKQRTYVRNAPHHLRSAFLVSSLSKELQKSGKRHSARVRVGDTVKVLRGQYKKITGTVERVLVHRQRVFIAGAEQKKKDGSKAFYPIHPSNVQIIGLGTSTQRRFAKAPSVVQENKKETKSTHSQSKGQKETREEKQ